MMYRTLPDIPAAPQPIVWSEGPKGLFVAWEEVARLLGRPIAPLDLTPEDDDRIYAALAAAGAPKWTRWAGGWLDSEGWYLDRPK
jgi:hypothetical protein